MRTLKNDYPVILSLLFMAMIVSCTSYKQVPYLQNSENFKDEQRVKVQEPIIQPHDMLTITVVSAQDQQAAMGFNLITPAENNRTNSLTTQPALQKYIVDVDGCVIIPNVGKVKLAGLTLPEAEALVLNKVKAAFLDLPTVVVRFVDYKVTVLGEVTSPGTFTVADGKINVFEALSLAKDLTIYGMRDNVKIVRENANGEKSIHEVNLNDVSLLTSPYYYLQQNDIVYVTPNKSKAKNSDIGSTTSLWFSGTSIAISLISLLFNIIN